MLIGLGVTEQEITSLWMTASPVNVASPVCMVLAHQVAGADHPEPVQAALKTVGFDNDEIKAVMAGKMEIYLRDHRIQELVARAADADTQTENRAAA